MKITVVFGSVEISYNIFFYFLKFIFNINISKTIQKYLKNQFKNKKNQFFLKNRFNLKFKLGVLVLARAFIYSFFLSFPF
jgi:hypothetical protein